MGNNSKELENLLINQGISLDEDIIDEDESAARISQNEMQYIAVILDDKTVSLNDFAVDSVKVFPNLK